MRGVEFNAFDLQADPYRVVDTDAFSGPQREIIFKELARTDNAVSVFRRFKSRDITLQGVINGASSDAVDQAIDDLKLKLLLAAQGNLDIDWAGGIRRWRAECKNVIISRASGDLSRAAFNAQFFCEKSFATDGQALAELLDETVTSGDIPYSVSPGGTYMASPVFTLTINSIDPDDSAVAITIGNPISSEYLTIPDRTYGAGDELIINCDTREVLHNSVPVASEGDFPAWAPGNGSVEYSDDATTRNISLLGEYEKRFM